MDPLRGLYEEGTWRGKRQWRCLVCPFDTLKGEEVIREHGTVSARTAEELARRARAVAGADIGVGVTGVAGPESVEDQPVGRVFLALDSAAGTEVRRWDLPGSRERVKERAARSALDMIRRHLLAEREGKR